MEKVLIAKLEHLTLHDLLLAAMKYYVELWNESHSKQLADLYHGKRDANTDYFCKLYADYIEELTNILVHLDNEKHKGGPYSHLTLEERTK